ncbi:MAG: class I SAM-dependent methyltransferase [Pseudomonadota bacterium]
MTLVDTPAAPDLVAVKQRQQATWAAGDYAIVGTTLQIVGESLAEAMDLLPGERVLDVAAGNGNASLAAARRFCDVVSTDYVGAWLKNGMKRAEAERLAIAFREADAEDLPFEDGSFAAVMSTFGVMFTANQEMAASELIRVCRNGGRIGLANWTPSGFVGQVFKTIGRHVPPPQGVSSPALWGTQERLDELFGADAAEIVATKRQFVFRYRSASDWVELWRRIYGPMNKAFQALSEQEADALDADLTALAEQSSVHPDKMIVPSEYLEVVIRRR